MPSPWCRRPVRRNAELIMGFSRGIGEAIFDRFDRDRSGKIDSEELRSTSNDGRSGRGALNFDNFIEKVVKFQRSSTGAARQSYLFPANRSIPSGIGAAV
uniref:EF-hand domain-containing protein n=1 Tax=Ananas comosus var. bracteatus TaxID=296719 RepID=A0A6V7NRP9_ANACO|nr:unnamed protein product [Ananas comosus var. bracteatus]